MCALGRAIGTKRGVDIGRLPVTVQREARGRHDAAPVPVSSGGPRSAGVDEPRKHIEVRAVRRARRDGHQPRGMFDKSPGLVKGKDEGGRPAVLR